MLRINNTNAPFFYKIWSLPEKNVTEDTITFLKGIGAEVRMNIHHDPISYRGQQFNYLGFKRIEIETTCDEQEMMLKLKYGNDLLLVMSECVLPNSMRFSTLTQVPPLTHV